MHTDSGRRYYISADIRAGVFRANGRGPVFSPVAADGNDGCFFYCDGCICYIQDLYAGLSVSSFSTYKMVRFGDVFYAPFILWSSDFQKRYAFGLIYDFVGLG